MDIKSIYEPVRIGAFKEKRIAGCSFQYYSLGDYKSISGEKCVVGQTFLKPAKCDSDDDVLRISDGNKKRVDFIVQSFSGVNRDTLGFICVGDNQYIALKKHKMRISCIGGCVCLFVAFAFTIVLFRNKSSVVPGGVYDSTETAAIIEALVSTEQYFSNPSEYGSSVVDTQPSNESDSFFKKVIDKLTGKSKSSVSNNLYNRNADAIDSGDTYFDPVQYGVDSFVVYQDSDSIVADDTEEDGVEEYPDVAASTSESEEAEKAEESVVAEEAEESVVAEEAEESVVKESEEAEKSEEQEKDTKTGLITHSYSDVELNNLVE